MAGHAGVRDYLHIALRHVAAYAAIRGLAELTRSQLQFAAMLRMTGHAFRVEIGWRLLARRLHMRIVARDAPHATRAGPIAFAQGH